MEKISWKLFKRAFPFICNNCNAGLWEKRAVCESCGFTLTIREMTKKDYKLWKRKR